MVVLDKRAGRRRRAARGRARGRRARAAEVPRRAPRRSHVPADPALPQLNRLLDAEAMRPVLDRSLGGRTAIEELRVARVGIQAAPAGRRPLQGARRRASTTTPSSVRKREAASRSRIIPAGLRKVSTAARRRRRPVRLRRRGRRGGQLAAVRLCVAGADRGPGRLVERLRRCWARHAATERTSPACSATSRARGWSSGSATTSSRATARTRSSTVPSTA